MAYVASKAAQNAMTSIMAMEFEKNNIPVEIFNIPPWSYDTDLNNHYTGPGSSLDSVVSEKIAEVINGWGKASRRVLLNYILSLTRTISLD